MISRFFGSSLLLLFAAVTTNYAFADALPTYAASSITITYTTPVGCCSGETYDSWMLYGAGLSASGSGGSPGVGLGAIQTVALLGQAFSTDGPAFIGLYGFGIEQGSLTLAGEQYTDVLFEASPILRSGTAVIPNQTLTAGELITVSAPATLTGSVGACMPVLPCEGAGEGYPTPIANIDFDLGGTLTMTFTPDPNFPTEVDLLTAQFVSSPEPATGPAILLAILVLFFAMRARKGMISRVSAILPFLLLPAIGTNHAFADPLPTYPASSVTIAYTRPTGPCCSNLDHDSWTAVGANLSAVGQGNAPSLDDEIEPMGVAFSWNALGFIGSPDFGPEQGTLTVAGQQYTNVFFYDGPILQSESVVIPNQPVTPNELITVSAPATLVGTLSACYPLLPCEGAGGGSPTPLPGIAFDLGGTLTMTFMPDPIVASDMDLVSAQFVSTREPATAPLVLLALAALTTYFLYPTPASPRVKIQTHAV